jgi:hypothetical protein
MFKSKLLLIGTVTALLTGGSSLAMAQNGNPTGGYPPVVGGAGGNPAVPGPAYFPQGSGSSYVAPGTAYRQPFKHHRRIYMSATRPD